VKFIEEGWAQRVPKIGKMRFEQRTVVFEPMGCRGTAKVVAQLGRALA
jgi:hypothetical protein